MKKKGYIAGSLFNEAEVKQRLYEGQTLASRTGDKIEWFNPIEAPINDKAKLPTAVDIFKGDTVQVINSDYIVADITNNDVGVAMELGIAFGLQYARQSIELLYKEVDEDTKKVIFDSLSAMGIKERRIFATCSDIRLATSGEYDGIHVPYGINQYLIGGIESMNSTIVSKFDGAVNILVDELNVER